MSANLPLRPDLEGEAPYGAPEIDVPVRLNVNENPYPPSAAVIETIATAVARAAQGLNRYPERDFPRLREALADYLEPSPPSPSPQSRSGRPTAPMRSCSMCCRPSAAPDAPA